MRALAKFSNQLTLVRLCCIPILWITAFLQLKLAFVVVFLLAGLTDLFDGYFARKLGLTSNFGAWFDSWTDNLIKISLLFWLYFLVPGFIGAHYVPLLFVVNHFLFTLVLDLLKYKQMAYFHFYSAKISNFFIFLFLFWMILLGTNEILFYITILAICISLTEKMLETIFSKKIEPNKVSYFLSR